MDNGQSKDVFVAFGKVFHSVEKLLKDKAVAFNNRKYKYAELESVLSCLRPLCKEYGIYFTQDYRLRDNILTVRTRVILPEDKEHELSFEASSGVEDITNPQKIGAVMTYLRRYALVGIFGIPLEDDDAQSAVEQPKKNIQQSPKSNEKKPPIDYSIVPNGKNKGSKWESLTPDKLAVALEWFKSGSKAEDAPQYVKAIESVMNLKKEDNLFDDIEEIQF